MWRVISSSNWKQQLEMTTFMLDISTSGQAKRHPDEEVQVKAKKLKYDCKNETIITTRLLSDF